MFMQFFLGGAVTLWIRSSALLSHIRATIRPIIPYKGYYVFGQLPSGYDHPPSAHVFEISGASGMCVLLCICVLDICVLYICVLYICVLHMSQEISGASGMCVLF